ncbi:hypothetical protein FHR83_004094 [Actinoplanes campanulatus]|uniref:site-specific DNA-methyltransferase (adenine-specific) n=1 Tax=Actinoplanes campanulatus TaxID=113559 RepID=A0A7W5AI91_9ACTN|nr:BREX-1 system adenine-specific DNA-methyltransferase PglX [Actinoplanes campanulatus]MBB3096424.1 hypothetical protein [Actinoplanes campanulatus]GGN18401.1 hypothetical protein GCM10010109_31460 [Actinoplanes campanulatus]GID38490.1 hypothetical protein Aca09nite_49960 [Actinoplanes campanulatus]
MIDTARLKTFATWARTALIREVTARIAVVLAPASAERVEQPNAVAAMERAIAASGRDAVADRVAYTWFNRIVALRFMDANGYTGIGVVSPAAGLVAGQPEVLAEAKRGNLDPEVVSGRRAVEAITGLLDGTRRSADPQGEAYALLLAEYCRHWNRAMPFMFEREGDWTELLIPTNLLAEDSVPARTVAVLTEDVCRDVEVIGWLYQLYISERKDEVSAGFKRNQKAGAPEIPAATQLFTPHWIVRYLVENSVGRLWLHNRPSSALAERMDYYLPSDLTSYPKVSSPEEIRVIDPACGSGHILTYAFDLLYAIYEEEGYAPSDIPGLILTHNLHGTEIDPRAGALAAFALTMKARARQRTFFNRRVAPNICVLEPVSFTPGELNTLVTPTGDRVAEESFWSLFENADTLGSLVRPRTDLVDRLRGHLAGLPAEEGDLLAADLRRRAERVLTQAGYLARGYHAVVANPPYLYSGDMNAMLSGFAKREYPDSKTDLFAMFIERCVDLAVPRAFIGMITMQGWMFLGSYAALRDRLLRDQAIVTMAHLDARAFDTIPGEVVATTAFLLVNEGHPDLAGTFVRLVEERGEAVMNAAFLESVAGRRPVYTVSSRQLRQHPSAPVAYWLSEAMLRAFGLGRPLGEIGEPRQGLATADNGRFVRQWHEVSADRTGFGLARDEALASDLRWFPYNKGGEFRRWYGNQEFVVNWQDDGAEIRSFGIETGRPRSRAQNTGYYFLPSVSWSKVGAKAAFRWYPQGFIFDVAGTSIFASERDLLRLAAVCNSTVARDLLAATSSRMNFEVGTLAQLPVPEVPEETAATVRELVEIHRADWDAREASWDFRTLDLVEAGGLLSDAVAASFAAGVATAGRARELETRLNAEVAAAYRLDGEADTEVSPAKITLFGNPEFRFAGKPAEEHERLYARERAADLVSYAVGCMFGRYSLDEPGLVLGHAGATVADYLARVPRPSFPPDQDNVIPVVDGEWFDDDIVGRFRQFLRVAFGDEHLEENLRWVTAALGVKDVRDYFVKSFYKDHVQRYRKRPVYWLFSSAKGSFTALVYLHRYQPSTVSTVLNEYLRQFRAKLTANRQHQERLSVDQAGTPRARAAAQKELDRLRRILVELDEYEHDVLYPLATRQLAIDLDDGVRANYPRFGAALRRIQGLEAGDE